MTPAERAEFIADVAAAIQAVPASLTDDEQRWVRMAIQKEAQSIELRKHTMAATSGTETPDSSVGGGMDLRKDKSLFKVISQEENKVEKSDLVGSNFRYNISDATDAAAAAARKDKNHVNIIRNQVLSVFSSYF